MRIIRISGFFALLCLISCDLFHGGDKGCPEIQGIYFDVNDLEISSHKVSSCCDDELNAFSPVPFGEFLLRIDYKCAYYSLNQNPEKFSFFNSAYGLSCPTNGQNGSKESLSELEVITLYDMDSQHKKGSSINDLIEFEANGARLPLGMFLSSSDRRIYSKMASLYLIQKPVLSDTCAFKISVLLDNGEKYTRISTPVIFQ